MTLPTESMKIKELFERDPGRMIKPIVRIDEHDTEVIRTELDEYVVTDEIKKDFSEIIDMFIESRNSIPESVCGWISGFFGSGKSHFLKILGYVLSNKQIRMDNGTVSGASTLFCDKHSIPGGKILEKEMKTMPVFVHMLTYDFENAPSVTRRIYEAVLKEIGFSNVPWIAEFERMLKKEGLWDRFLSFIKQQEGKEWQHVRTLQPMARPLIVRALTQLDPKRFPDPKIADKTIDDVQRNLQIDQGTLAERLLELAEELDPVNGRVVVLLDEVGMYIGANPDRINDLNTVAEHISKIGKGKLWLFVTAQEALDEAVPKVLGYTAQFHKIKDRFQTNIQLTPENIDTVVRKRLLQKKIDDQRLDMLKNMFSMYSGNLTTGAVIKNPARDYHHLLTKLDDYERFAEYYPFMPYHIRLMQEIFGILRAKGSTSQALSGKERAMLQVARTVIISLADSDIGRIVTFDMVYNAINEELTAVSSAQHAEIEKDIAEKGRIGQVTATSVAKSLFLLQNVGQWLPCTAENIAATLFSDLRMDRNAHLTDVKDCLHILVDGKWISEEQGKYRFLSEIERTFEQDVERQTVTEPEKRELSDQIAKDVLSEIKEYNYNNTRTFDIHVVADDHDVTSSGHVNLIFYSPRSIATNENLLDVIRVKSIADKETLFWTSKKDDRYDEEIERTIKLKKALSEKEHGKQSEDEARILNKHKKELELLVHDVLPRIFSKSGTSGIIVYQGVESSYNGNRNLHDIFVDRIKKVIDEIFTEFPIADYRIEKDSYIGSILNWQGGKLPNIYHQLKIIDDSNNILVDRPVAATVLGEIRRRQNQGAENQTGASIADHFERIPYGWDPRIVRLTLASLFKNGSISVNISGKDYLSPSETTSHDAFLNSRVFNKARFAVGQEVSKQQRKHASELINEVFGETGGNTNEEVDEAIEKAIRNRFVECQRFATIAETQKLPFREGMRQLQIAMEHILESHTVVSRIFNFIDTDNENVFKIQVPLLDKLVKFENNKNLEKYFTIRNFLDINGSAIVSIAGNREIEKAVEKLKNAMVLHDFINRWTDIYGEFQKLLSQYSSIYSQKHEERNFLVKGSIESLKSHPAFNSDLKEEAEKKLARLQELMCSVEKPNLDEAITVCEGCSTSLNNMIYNLEMIPAREQQIRKDLAELWSKEHTTNRKKNLEGFSITIASSNELAVVTKKIKEVSESALDQGKSVKIDVRVD